MKIIVFVLIFAYIFFCSPRIHATREIYISNKKLAKQFSVYQCGDHKKELLPGKIYNVGAKVFYRGMEYSGVVLKTFFVFEEKHALFINAKYSYFIGQHIFWITDKIKLPYEVWKLKPVKVLCYLYITNSYRPDDNVLICSFSYNVSTGEYNE